jgi:hypothetical protein
MNETGFLFIELQEGALTEGRAFDGVAFGTFRDMLGREIELDADDAGKYIENTQAAIEATRAESGELVGLPIDAEGHDKGDGAGWIVAAELVDGIIRLLPKWTEIGRELISKGIRRFFSATIDVTNKVVLGGTLTNWPATRDENNRVMLRPIELSSGLYTVDELESEPVEAAPLDISEDDMAEEKAEVEEVEVIEEAGVTIVTNVMNDPPAEVKAASLPANQVNELLKEFGDSGKQEPHELIKQVEEHAERLANIRVTDMLEKRERTWQITQLASEFTGGNKYGLPVGIVELTDFLESLDANQFEAAKVLFGKITENGLVEFEEIGHGRKLLKKHLPQVYRDPLRETLAAGNTIADFFEAMGLDNPNAYDLREFGGK